MRQEHGFTLIELLIVLAILGILVGIVAMSVGGLTDTATKRSMTSEYGTVQTAIDTYHTQDVVVEGEDSIPDQSEEIQIQGGDTVTDTFGQYLKRDTKYYYTWADDGEDLTVYESDEDDAMSYDGSDWENDD
ncbi:MAG: type II secretion system protein [Anaerolineales bacterium]